MYDVTIIGAGIVGTFIARELSKYQLNILLLDKENDVANGTTKANSAICHAGYDAEPNTLKARFNVEGNKMMEDICRELDVPFKRIGSLVVAFSQEEMVTIEELYQRGIANNVPNLKILNKKELVEKEPNISPNAVGALYAPTAGIMGPFELAFALAENAVDNGVELLLNNEVKKIDKLEEGYRIYTNNKEIDTKYVVNCAGVYADEIHNMVAEPQFKIVPRRGQYFLLDRIAGSTVNSVIFQCPVKNSKGVVVLPTVHGNLLVGPDAQDLDDKEDRDTTDDRLEYVRKSAYKTSEKIPFNTVITSFAGLRASPDTKDFIIGEIKGTKGFIDVAGIESPGLSASPAIGKYVAQLLKNIDGSFKENPEFKSTRKRAIHFMELSNEEKNEIIKKDPRYGRIICRCENITEGEIVDAIHRNVGGTTVDGIKRRVRPGMGRCQGGFCQPRVIEILARELGKDFTEIPKDGLNSNIAIRETK
ncbi:NAD(P)/FAD-dependent oxidoreductase [Wansuia hejianensis]|uniref:NAD(P)/FAD-dependent oxidoreductase n=1 Tax=Wansuia hejianensis TaxID=2763667 RepID=A0A926IMM6_9FIRM|nr:NAD(P)/FAD-dependent oxidoreductase [Wansuia hejianensis]MBC8589813.1 NAD(P)/FAD-dependent oxidoreductase [Wansuia hejianensis]